VGGTAQYVGIPADSPVGIVNYRSMDIP
jgi:hypothetical protein